jgi:diadenosine tetraphosphate (Ap4A) HIT family hydrolase
MFQEAQMDSCIYCSIASRSGPTITVHEDGKILAFPAGEPAAPFHQVVMLRVHGDAAVEGSVGPELVGRLLLIASEISKQNGHEAFRIVSDSNNKNAHWYIHVLAGRTFRSDL